MGFDFSVIFMCDRMMKYFVSIKCPFSLLRQDPLTFHTKQIKVSELCSHPVEGGELPS